MNIKLSEIVFFFTLFGVLYSYFIYPSILFVLPRKKRLHNKVSKQPEGIELPFISLIITAYNEQDSIKEKITNTLDTDYPYHLREILVASDGSTDNTNDYVSEFSDQGVRLIKVPDRKGKENAQLAAIQEAKGEILIFSDVATKIPKEAIRIIASTFSDPEIGAISSEDRFITEDGSIAGEGAYVKYEMWLRRLEAEVKSLVGLSGSFFAVRKVICKDWDISVPSDFNTALNCIRNGYVAVSHPDVLGYYPNLKDESKEYSRKLRTVIRGMAAIANKPSVLNPFKFGIFSLQVFSHKIMRWLVPWFMLILLITNVWLYETHVLYCTLLAAQFIFYGLAVLGWLSIAARSKAMIKIPYFFMQVNFAIAHAGVQFIKGHRITMWEPSQR